MAIKKILIGSHEWHYALVTQHDGSIAVVVTKPDGSTQSLTVTDVQYDKMKSIISFMCNGRRFVMRLAQASQHQVVCSASGKVITTKPIVHKQLQSLFLPAAQSSQAPSGPSHDLTSIKSPLAGRITKILIAEGQAVIKGQPLIMIESMKMENELCAPVDASIKTVLITPGDVVKPNQILLIFA